MALRLPMFQFINCSKLVAEYVSLYPSECITWELNTNSCTEIIPGCLSVKTNGCFLTINLIKSSMLESSSNLEKKKNSFWKVVKWVILVQGEDFFCTAWICRLNLYSRTGTFCGVWNFSVYKFRSDKMTLLVTENKDLHEPYNREICSPWEIPVLQ